MQPELPDTAYDIEVELTMLPYEECGRDLPILAGFRSGHFYLDNCYWIASFYPKDTDELWPGETAPVYVRFFYHPEALQGRLQPGKLFELHEGYRPTGKGVILALLNFEQHVAEALQQEEERNARLADPNRKQLPAHWERPHHRFRKKNQP